MWQKTKKKWRETATARPVIHLLLAYSLKKRKVLLQLLRSLELEFEYGKLVEGRLGIRRRHLRRWLSPRKHQSVLRGRESACLPWPSHLRSKGTNSLPCILWISFDFFNILICLFFLFFIMCGVVSDLSTSIISQKFVLLYASGLGIWAVHSQLFLG